MTQNADNFLFYAGINTFGGYKYTRDLKNIDIAIMGVPFDSGTSNRSGTRMGPNSIRSMSHLVLGFNYMWRDILNLDKIKPNIIDYGDIGQSYGSKSVDTMIESTFTHAKKGVGGPTTHHIRTILKNLAGINVVASDIVEVAPQYDHGEITSLAAASVAQDIICLMAYTNESNNQST